MRLSARNLSTAFAAAFGVFALANLSASAQSGIKRPRVAHVIERRADSARVRGRIAERDRAETPALRVHRIFASRSIEGTVHRPVYGHGGYSARKRKSGCIITRTPKRFCSFIAAVASSGSVARGHGAGRRDVYIPRNVSIGLLNTGDEPLSLDIHFSRAGRNVGPDAQRLCGRGEPLVHSARRTPPRKTHAAANTSFSMNHPRPEESSGHLHESAMIRCS